MLILTRKLGESITIGGDIKIIFLDIIGKHLRIGIEAPKSISVHRTEIYKAIQEQNLKAVAPDIQIIDIWGQLRINE